MLFPTNFFDAWRTYSALRKKQRRHRETIEAVSDLPPHILRDIGWPGRYERQRRYRGW